MSTGDNSREAYEAIKPNAGTLRAKVLEFIRSKGDFGATDFEIQAALEMRNNTQTPRRLELLKSGNIRAAGSRKTGSGRSATVWVVDDEPKVPLFRHSNDQMSLFPDEKPERFHE